MSKLGLIALLATLLLLAFSATLVEATCGHCYSGHACNTNGSFQICFDGVPNAEYSFDCPEDKPICTQYADICMSEDAGRPPACGDTSLCDQCNGSEIFACTSLNTFGVCFNGTVNPGRITCQDNYFCSVTGAKTGTPCVYGCDPVLEDSCDREENGGTTSTTTEITTSSSTESSTDSTSTSTDSTSTDSTSTESTSTESTSTSTSTVAPVNANAFCQNSQKTGRFAIPSDTVCTTFIYCSYKASAWQGTITACPADKPYFNAASACGTVKPAGAGCV